MVTIIIVPQISPSLKALNFYDLEDFGSGLDVSGLGNPKP